MKYTEKGYINGMKSVVIPMRKEMKTVRVRNKRFNPGFVLRMVLGSKCSSSDLEFGGSEEVGASEISAMAESREAPSGITV